MERLFAAQVDPDMVVNFTAADMPLVTVAEWFDSLFPDQILIPASQARASITTDGAEQDIKLRDLIGKLGLRTTSEEMVGADCSGYSSDA